MQKPLVLVHGANSNTSELPAGYELRDMLGEGAFGQVFEAWDKKLQRNVAIKRLKNTGDAAQSNRLMQEARMAASLQHAAFVKIFAIEEHQGRQSIVMELVRGQTLKALLGQASLDEQQAIAITRQIAAAMCEAHDSGLVHGDLKPSNLMVQASGAVRILDFGLAAQTDAQATTSLLQADPHGTIAYMAPELLQGHAPRATSDIYALGVIFYELLTGARPFANLNGLALAAAHMQSSSEQWPFPPTMRVELARLIRAMTAVPVERRLPGMQQVGEHLADLDGPLAEVQAAQPRRITWRPGRRLLMAGAVALALCAAWFASPRLPSLASLKAALQPYSEAAEMQHGLQALSTWDRPGGLEAAEKHFSTILEHSPDNAAAVAGTGLVYCLRYSSDHQDEIWLRKAEAAAQQALRLNDHLALSHVAQALVLRQEGKPEAALAEFDQALNLDPENIFALNGKLNTWIGLRRLDLALQNAEDDLRRFPGERLFADQIGTIHYMQSQYPEAEKAFRQSIRIQPDAVAAYANLSAALASQNRQDEALHVLQQGLQVRPSAWLYSNLGNILFLRGDYVGAAAAFEDAVSPTKGNPADYLGWANLGDTLLWIPGREAEARKAYARASELLAPRLARSPDNVMLVSRMALYYARSGDKARCEPLLQHALALAPGAADVQFRAGLAYELTGERQKALGAINRALKLGYPVKFVEAAPELVELRRDPGYAPSH